MLKFCAPLSTWNSSFLPNSIYSKVSFSLLSTQRFHGMRSGVRMLKKHWTRGRPRKVHIEYPTRQRSPIARLDDKYSTLYYVSLGYTTKVNKSKLPEDQRAIMEWRRKNKHNWLYGGKIALAKAQAAMEKKNYVCLVFARGWSHELIESFTMEEILELEKMLPQIKASMDKHAKSLPAEEKKDSTLRHRSLGISRYSVSRDVKLSPPKVEIILPEDKMKLLSKLV